MRYIAVNVESVFEYDKLMNYLKSVDITYWTGTIPNYCYDYGFVLINGGSLTFMSRYWNLQYPNCRFIKVDDYLKEVKK